MRILASLSLVLATLFSILPTAAHAADVAFFPVESTNLPPENAAGVGELLAQAYASVSGQAVLAPSRTAETVSQSASYEEAAGKLGVSEYVRTSAVAVGRRTVVSATRYRVDGAPVHSSKMTVEAIEDMTNVSDRMARALYQGVDDEQVRTLNNITLTEARPKNRLWTEKVFGFKTGIHAPFASDAVFKNHLSLQFDIRLESERYFLEFAAGIITPSDFGDDVCGDYGGSCKGKHGSLGGFTAELGGNYFLTQGNVGLYVGGGVIPRLTIGGEAATAAPFAQVGVMLPRTSSTRFYADVRTAQFVLPTKLNNGNEVYPTEVALHVGVGW